MLHAKNQPSEALVAYRQAVAVKPEFLAGHSAMATLLLQQGKLDEVSVQLAQLKKLADSHPQTKYIEAQLAFLLRDFKSARDLLQLVLKVAPGNVQALQLAGAVELQLNSLPQAEGYLTKALKAAPELPLARRLLVMTYVRSGQSSKAMAALLPGLNRENVDPELLTVAGEVYLQSGDVKKAEEYFAKASKQAPEDRSKRTTLALARMKGLISAHLRRRELDKALKAIDGLEKKQPDKPLAANLRGRTLLAKQDIAGARRSFERALVIDPMHFPAVASLAGLDMADKKPDHARKRFDAVLVFF